MVQSSNNNLLELQDLLYGSINQHLNGPELGLGGFA
jgi:hypothetical protein